MSGLEDEIWQRIQRQREAEDVQRDEQSAQEALALERGEAVGVAHFNP